MNGVSSAVTALICCQCLPRKSSKGTSGLAWVCGEWSRVNLGWLNPYCSPSPSLFTSGSPAPRMRVTDCCDLGFANGSMQELQERRRHGWPIRRRVFRTSDARGLSSRGGARCTLRRRLFPSSSRNTAITDDKTPNARKWEA